MPAVPSPPPRSAEPSPRVERVIGVDPGSRFCGWGLVESRLGTITHVDNGVIGFSPKAPLAERLLVMLDKLGHVLQTYGPTVAAVEGIFQHRNARSALILGHARGVALVALARAGLTVDEYTPQQVKKAVTGSGRAEKEQVAQAIALRLGLPDLPQADAADAVAVALCHAQTLAFPKPVDLPSPAKGQGRAGQNRRADAALLALYEERRSPRS